MGIKLNDDKHEPGQPGALYDVPTKSQQNQVIKRQF